MKRMTDEQYLRWKDTAIRMAKKCTNGTEKRKTRVLEEVERFFYWREFQHDWHEVQDWDGNETEYSLAEEVDDFFDEHIHWNRKEGCYTGGKFYYQVVCCIQVAFGLAVKPSLGGVVGYTVRDIRNIWDRDVPNWVKDGWDAPFDSMSDETLLWL